MKRLGYVVVGLLSIVCFPSCVKRIVMDAKERPKVVVACILSDDSLQILTLSYTKGASLSEVEPLTKATALLYEGGNKIGEFTRQDGGDWTLDYAALPDHNYRIEVCVPGYEQIYAEQTMPSEPPPLRSIKYNLFECCIEPYSGWIYPDPSDNVDGLYECFWPEDEPYPQDETYYIKYKSSSPLWICVMSYNAQTGQHELVDAICTETRVDLSNALGRNYEPPAKDVPNPYKLSWLYELSPGLKESFYSAHLMEMYPALRGKPYYKSYIRLSESMIGDFYISGDFPGEYCETGTDVWGYADSTSSHKGYVQCSVASADLDKYLLDACKYQMIQESTDYTTIYLRDNIFTNIVGGLGIFGARISRKYPWTPAFSYIDSGVICNKPGPESIDDPRRYQVSQNDCK